MVSPPDVGTERSETTEVDGGLATTIIWSVAAVIVIAIGVAIWVAASGGGPVGAADAEPVVVFDGTACIYEGPTEIEEGPVNFMVTNETDAPIYLLLTSFTTETDLNAELEFLAVGSQVADPYEREMPGATREVSQFGPANGRNARIALLDSGWFVVDCVNWPPAEGQPDHAWRGAVFQIIE